MKRYHLIGIGGIGMCGLAQVLLHEGISVSGSDRSYDRGENLELFNKLKGLGIKIYPQDGTSVRRGINKIITSRAIEEDNPDLISAKKLKTPVSYRQDELKKIFRKYSGIAVAGTSGKTTVVGMIGCVFDVAGQDITVINGGIIRNYVTKKDIGNVHIGRLPYFCIETDESEGDLKGYYPEIAVITNIGHDHMSYEKTIKVYKDFAMQIKDTLILNKDINIKHKKKITFPSVENIELYPANSTFKIDGQKFRLNVPGLHNIHNALAAVGVSRVWGISTKQIVKGLENFKGIKRRFELVSLQNGIKVIDDYAHNPDKVKASIQTARLEKGRVIAIYQPHGYVPTKMFLNKLAEAFADSLGKNDFLFIAKIYYAGGRVKKNISSGDLVRKIKSIDKSLDVQYIPDRDNIKTKIQKIAGNGDTILVMGARDVTLSDWAKEILQ